VIGDGNGVPDGLDPSKFPPIPQGGKPLDGNTMKLRATMRDLANVAVSVFAVVLTEDGNEAFLFTPLPGREYDMVGRVYMNLDEVQPKIARNLHRVKK